ncbi:Peptidoglycan D,D-transpeptidase MrdA [Paraconexibacter sp. AEG42_29]|uniref:Peptidoglycan D,D-transpeptidase MrdA n=1 Tax=Paraconexibacter sp. AEG42_29 TaxID=2997339 RepID=A0AAU7ATN6_9ACTN
MLLGGAVAGALALTGSGDADRSREAAVRRFTTAWARQDPAAMWPALDPASKRAHPRSGFVEAYRAAYRAAGVTRVRVLTVNAPEDGASTASVAVRTRRFGTLRGTVSLPVTGSGDTAGVRWDASQRLPGLRKGEPVRLRRGTKPKRAAILAAGGAALDADALGASIVGKVGPPATGLQRLYASRVAGHASERLLFGTRVIGRVPAVRGTVLRTTIRPGLQQKAAAALGDRLGGIAVVRPRDGAVLALAGLAVSAPQPPGSTFKIITTAAALKAGLASPRSTYPVRTAATLSGTKLRNASDESCGGTLEEAFAESCNSVFAPLGAKLGARRLVAAARAFGFEEAPRIPAIKPSTTGGTTAMQDDLAVGAAAIGQNRDLATPLEMATVGATIANGGVRFRPHLGASDPPHSARVVSAKVARQVRAMMLAVVRSGTGRAAALPGVAVAGKTGTAELRATAGRAPDPKNTNAWFVAFAPADKPRVAVAVMLIGAGAGGASAAPVARDVLAAALAG